ncbi:MAG: LLM class flavin-dependent oxidoreductase [Micromonosporaceae bacterium]|nr:LLM class flavin-dependent oxidoreductase [Micromonosporaceae bacterium]
MTTLGAVFLPQLPPERLRPVARAAEEAGLEELWLWEDCFFESGIASAAAVLGWTERLRIGVGLLPAPLRNVALTAMEVSTLHRMFPGRVLVGVGHGVQEWMAQVGARHPSPMKLLRAYVSTLRALLRGEQVTLAGDGVSLDRVALEWPAPSATVYVGAIGPRTLRLSGELADGTILTAGTSPDGVRRARELIDQGRAAGGRIEPHPVVCYLLAATGPGAADRIEAERRNAGIDPAADAAVAGEADAVAEAVHRWAQAGADTVVLQPTRHDPDPEAFVRFVATEVRPRIR